MAFLRRTGASEDDVRWEVSGLAGTDTVAPSVRSLDLSPQRVDRLVRAFLDHRILTHLFRQLRGAHYDLSSVDVDRETWQECSTSTVVPAVDGARGGRIPLADIERVLDEHRKIERETMLRLAEAHPNSFMVMFGQGISLAHPGYIERFSHDIDLLVAKARDGYAIVGTLVELGFIVTDGRSGSFRGVPYNDWTLDAPDIDGHSMHVDISTGSITRSDSWMRPLVLTDVFDRAQRVVAQGQSPAHPLLVPSDTHQLLMLAEKAQRTHRYDARVRCDATVLARDGRIDVAVVRNLGERLDLMNTLDWILGDRRPLLSHRRQPRDEVSRRLIAVMAHATAHPAGRDPRTWQHRPSTLHGLAADCFRRLVR